jgi:hypothetical protein
MERYASTNGNEINAELETQKSLTYDAWINRIRSLGLDQVSQWHRTNMFSFTDPIADLAMQIDLFNPEVIWTDITETNGDLDPAITLHQNFASSSDYFDDHFIKPTGKVLVLTEGASDTKILAAAIPAMYPEFEDMFEFVDFEEFKIEGGVSMVVKMAKAFAGVRMAQSILALFDNDAAGLEGKADLDRIVGLPKSIKAMTLPNLEIARSYPTVGPEGERLIDINGAACSIEFFLGRDSLTDEKGCLLPVRWTNWNQRAQRYQGALEFKNDATKKFLNKLKHERPPQELRDAFPEMNQLLQEIFIAFH